MQLKKVIVTIGLVLTILSFFSSIPTLADSDDVLSGAVTAAIGNTSGSITEYQEKDYYNFTGSNFRTYNFTLDLTNEDNNLVDFYLLADNGTQIAY